MTSSLSAGIVAVLLGAAMGLGVIPVQAQPPAFMGSQNLGNPSPAPAAKADPAMRPPAGPMRPQQNGTAPARAGEAVNGTIDPNAVASAPADGGCHITLFKVTGAPSGAANAQDVKVTGRTDEMIPYAAEGCAGVTIDVR